MPLHREIRRYRNRKLYDVVQSCYITLGELGEYIRAGDSINVIEQDSKKDLTALTMIQVLHLLEKESHTEQDKVMLNRIIRSTDGSFTGYIQELEKSIANPSSQCTTPLCQ
ncbi:MAG: hypothetical protein HQK50_13640 [Oligoflexia bacterium]|nr:hypothetical protein [Oligoflexia bacterium]